MKKQKEIVSARVESNILDEVKKMSKKQRRTISQIVEMALQQFFLKTRKQ